MKRAFKAILFHKGVAFVATFLWMGIIFYLSHQPVEQSKELSGGILVWVEEVLAFLALSVDGEGLHFFIRKGAHFFAYFVLGILLVHSLRLVSIPSKIKPFFYAFYALFISIVYAVIDEWHQTFVPGRSGEWRDVFIDSIGSLVGIILYCIICIVRFEKEGNWEEK